MAFRPGIKQAAVVPAAEGDILQHVVCKEK
jgi:hypothetical protein